jgi:CHRD domain
MRARLVALAGVVAVAAGIGVLAAAAGASTATTKIFTVKLTGGVERPVGDRTGRGTVTVTLKTSGSVCWKFKIAKIDGAANAAHIHKGKRGVAGPVVVPFGKAFKATGCTKAAPSLVKAILAHPKAYYVNVHNGKHPAGALRSQL